MDLSGAEAASTPIDQIDASDSDSEVTFNFKNCTDGSLVDTSVVRDNEQVQDSVTIKDWDSDEGSVESNETIYTPIVGKVNRPVLDKPADTEVLLQSIKAYFDLFGSNLESRLSENLLASQKGLEGKLSENLSISQQNLESRLSENFENLSISQQNLESRLSISQQGLESRLSENFENLSISQQNLESRLSENLSISQQGLESRLSGNLENLSICQQKLENRLSENFENLSINQQSLENRLAENLATLSISQRNLECKLSDNQQHLEGKLSENFTILTLNQQNLEEKFLENFKTITSGQTSLSNDLERMNFECKERSDRLEDEIYFNRRNLNQLENEIVVQGENLNHLKNEVDRSNLEKACEKAEMEATLMRKMMKEVDKAVKKQIESKPAPPFTGTIPKAIMFDDVAWAEESDSAESHDGRSIRTREKSNSIRLREPLFISDSYQSAPDFLHQVELYFKNIGVTSDRGKLTAFPEFLRGNPAKWCRIQLANITSWAQLCEKFLRQYFNRNEIGQEWENLSLDRFKGDCEAFVIRAWQLQSTLNQDFDDQRKCANIIRKLPGYLQDRVKDRYHQDFNEFLANVKEIAKTNNREYATWKSKRGNFNRMNSNNGSDSTQDVTSNQNDFSNNNPTANQDTDNYFSYKKNNYRKFRNRYRNNNYDYNRQQNDANKSPYYSNYRGRNNYRNRGAPTNNNQNRGKGPSPPNLGNITLVPVTGLPGTFTVTGAGLNLAPLPVPSTPVQLDNTSPLAITANNTGIPNA